jgi:D-alanyl-D-alanine carboxypeptidase
MRKRFVILIALVVLCAGLAGYGWLQRSGQAPSTDTNKSDNTNQPDNTPNTTEPGGFNAEQYSLDDPASIWVVANKHRPLNPITYTPNDLTVPTIPMRNNITSDERQVRVVTARALEAMITAAEAQGVHFNLQSGYRSYNFQITLYNRYVQQQGQAAADSQSARPGYSEHQTGLAADLGSASKPSCDVEQCFGDTTEGKWLAAHAYEYGFIIRYPEGKQAVTGYIYEPWHVRYVGLDLAGEMRRTGVTTLEEFFSLGAAPSYDS